MILTVTLNAALDVTYHVDALTLHTSHRVHAVAVRAGGKGINVARVLHALGHQVVATGLAGGADGQRVRAELRAAGIAEEFVPISGETRRTVTVVDDDATVFNEPGPLVTPGEWRCFRDTYRSLLARADAVVLAGSLCRGLPYDGYAELCTLAASHGVPTVLDADGEVLRHGLAGRPTVVKPNVEEMGRVTGDTDALAGARTLRGLGAATVVVSRGPAGLLCLAPTGTWSAVSPAPVSGNPTGAGDAAVAAVAAGMVTGLPWPQRLADAAALSAAAVLAPLAGDIDQQAYRRLLPHIRSQRLEETDATHPYR
ncbi:MAG: 1-phosphofructokinase family hexose kinase [Sciscionella sp.]